MEDIILLLPKHLVISGSSCRCWLQFSMSSHVASRSEFRWHVDGIDGTNDGYMGPEGGDVRRQRRGTGRVSTCFTSPLWSIAQNPWRRCRHGEGCEAPSCVSSLGVRVPVHFCWFGTNTFSWGRWQALLWRSCREGTRWMRCRGFATWPLSLVSRAKAWAQCWCANARIGRQPAVTRRFGSSTTVRRSACTTSIAGWAIKPWSTAL